MTITNGYAALANFKTRFDVQGTDNARDTEIEAVIQAVSRMIDGYCHREFFTSTNDEDRVFTAVDHKSLFPSDIVSITALKTDEDADGTFDVTWATSDYITLPLVRTANVTPITWIETRVNGSHYFPLQEGGVQITGKFGYCTLANAPDVVKEACYLQSHRLWMRKNTPMGVAGSAGMGQMMAITRLDPDVELLLDQVKRVM